jgi:23S rRNA pseudouridine1911/1915/1917 synthase
MENRDGRDIHLDESGQPRIIRRSFVVDEASAGDRLDHFLKRQIPRLSRTKLQKVIRSDLSRSTGGPLKPHSPVAANEILTLHTPARPEPPCPRYFEVLYEDSDLRVVHKPAGLAVHASARYYFNTLTRVLLETYPDEDSQICHRLDRETSSCLVVARSKEIAIPIKEIFARKVARKTYHAIVHGKPPWEEESSIDLPLGLVDADATINIRMVVREDASPATTQVRLLERAGDFSLVECRPITGRQHQIRAHLAAVGFPIVGDKLYAHGDDAFREFCDKGLSDEMLKDFLLPRHALHAARIELPHPRTSLKMVVESPMPEDMADFLAHHSAAD